MMDLRLGCAPDVGFARSMISLSLPFLAPYNIVVIITNGCFGIVKGEEMAEGKILIIDDDPDITEAMAVVLENRGYEVRGARDGAEGMEMLQQSPPDLIILDVMMRTSQEGFELSRELKGNPQYKNIPILMLTAVKQKTGLDFKAEAGDPSWLPVEEYLDKPVKPNVLLEKVEDLLSDRRA
jgi:CheY-like chemotaxis protein